jgi:signal transduction histidine kinase
MLNFTNTDSGPGLAKEDVSLLFKRFSQATKQSNKVFGGSGLGLWISKQISHQSELLVT